jgi:hypothetical protein
VTPITKQTKKTNFSLDRECQKAWELIKQKYIETLILISPNWQVEFHVHTYASLLTMGAMLSQNVIGKSDQLIVYAFSLLNRTKSNYSTIERRFSNGFFFAQVQTLFVGQ